MSPAPSDSPPDLTDPQIVLDYGLKAQVRLLPYALGFFGIGLPVYIWAAQFFLSGWQIVLNLALFACVWAAFFLIKPALQGDARPTPRDLRVRTRRQWLCGGLWAISLLSLSLTALTGGNSAHIFVLICAGAAVGVIFFSAPVLLYLLTLAPLAMIGPIIALHLMDGYVELANLVSAGLVLALAFGLILNRHLQEHYRLEFNQLRLSQDREAALSARDALTHSQMALMQTLSREVTTGLRGLDQNLTQGLTLLTRAPAPRHYVENARAGVEHLLGLITTTLDDDTARSGQMTVDTGPLDLDGLVYDVTEGFYQMAQIKGLELTVSGSAPLQGAAIGDPARVEQILSHLLSNALQYTPKGKVEVKLLPPAHGLIRLEVVDSGPGLDAAELVRAFAPHERITRTSAGHSGAGLGLNLSKTLAELMGGGIGAQSTPDVGSKFWFDLPFDPAAVAPRPVVELSPAPAAESATGLRVLLLSNDSLRSAQLRDTLETLGHKCLTATTRHRALSLAAKGEIDALLVATGAFEDLSDDGNRTALSDWLGRLRSTQESETLTILALLPDGHQAEPLAGLGIRPLLMPQSEDALRRALMAA
ncbi:HAMP domain-containing sensor histidine kinase [Asticcacaulis sp. BYS171W]|uniref:histidine kinase n=1 Tax=Asticcacaulis aquaticus TaxID=2984212 RepID=A0ABT5HVL2_9CAUL|nr:HAMP domain-containing sensor histidine kinase [Asticcacaulis aquaticus]MDC7683885.1 HAMP domain-containing sensor histidine kinase [Asticcacaulis aquaticus]